MSDKIRIYGLLESGLIGGYVTDYSQIKNAPDPKVNTINELTELILQNPNDPNIPYTVAKAYDSLNNNIFIEGHAKAVYMSDGSTVEDTINEIKTNGGGDIDLSKYETKLEALDKLVEAKLYTNTAIVNLVDSAPETLNTLNELAVAIQENEDVVEVLNQSIGSKQDTITDLETIRQGAAKGATALLEHQDISGKQDKLVSGTNIKTINGTSILGSGNIVISSGGGEGTDMFNYTYIGTATPSTTPNTLTKDNKVFYIATEEGDYTNFGVGNISELSIIKSENGSWKVEGLGVSKSVGQVYELTPTPARHTLDTDTAGALKGYKVNLSGLYNQGVRYVIFSGRFYASTSSVVAGAVIDNEGNVEDFTKYDNNIAKTYKLPVTANSSYLWATYDSSENGWQPTTVFFENTEMLRQTAEASDRITNTQEHISKINDSLGYCLRLTRGSLSHNGKPQDNLLAYRVHTDVLTIIGNNVQLTLNQGYYLDYYLFDNNNVYVEGEKGWVNSLDLDVSEKVKSIRFVFRIGNDASRMPIGIEDDIVLSMTGVFTPFDKSLYDEIKTLKDNNYKRLLSGYIIPISSSVENITTSDNFTVLSANMIDTNSLKVKKILNDNGVEINDNSSYYDCFIPVKGFKHIYLNFNVQRLYYYNSNKEWLGRAFVTVDNGKLDSPIYLNGQEVAFVKIQVLEIPQYNIMVGLMPFESVVSYKKNTQGNIYKPLSYVYNDNLSLITVDAEIRPQSNEYVTPSFTIPEVWEPDNVDSGYSTPIGRRNTLRANWTAENKYNYVQFLEQYYDVYLTKNDNYKVTKKSLGNDSSNMGYELFEYDFMPKNYTRVVMLSAGMNAVETSCIWGLATFVRELMKAEEEGMKYLKENVRFKILPFICPSSFDEEPLKYQNFNNVRVNKNFSYKRKWYDIGEDQYKGDFPDSEAETVILKKWINDHSNIADLYIDCHSDTDITTYGNILTAVITSDTQTRSLLEKTFPILKQYYIEKGTATSSAVTHSWVEGGLTYPKTIYSFKECGIPALMIEQYISSTMYGSDGQTNNDEAGIKNYVAMLRLYIYAILYSNPTIIDVGEDVSVKYKALKNLL